MRRLTRLCMLIVPALLAACGAPPATAPVGVAAQSATTELQVFAAASLTEACQEIGAAFEAAQPGARVVYNFAGSQQLAQQIAQGAPVDLFASANGRQMEVAIAAGRVVTGTQRVFVRNRLVVVYPRENPARPRTLQDLARPGLKLVLATKAVPIGQYALDFLDKAARDAAFGVAFKERVLRNVVSYEENVRAVLSKVALGEADAGIVYSSDITGDAAERVGRIEIPDALNTIAAYPIAPIADARQPELARAFIDYLLAPEAQAILARYGLIPAAEAE